MGTEQSQHGPEFDLDASRRGLKACWRGWAAAGFISCCSTFYKIKAQRKSAEASKVRIHK